MRRATALFLLFFAALAPARSEEPRVSRFGEYQGYSQPVYDGWERTSFYVPVRDGTRLAMDLFRPTKDGKVETGEYSHVIVAIGIVPNTENIGLEKLVEMDRGFIQIDPFGRTRTKGLWAIGDCVPGPWLAHKASHEGVTAVEAIAQELGNKEVHPHPLDRNAIPGCTYCRPQVASVGMTEAKAKEAGYEVKAGTFPFIGNGKAIALGEPEGFIKTVFDAKTGELLGAHMVGAEVTELIQGYTVGKVLETTEAELMQTVFPHPTLSEMMHESVLAAYGRQLHM